QDYSVETVSMHYERLSASFPGSRLHAMKIRVPPGYASGLESHEGEELLYVLAGHLNYHVDHRTYHLGAGDSMHIDSHRPHRISNPGATVSEILWASTFQVFEDPEGAEKRRSSPFPQP
ncbi:MAG TPA: cupin domain-containing protein, partial [Holophaga sp.]|nr:cupin domain-containing protein [Holophaga sp.]